ncbi:MAG TPA: hypothetical protein VFI77_05075 [Gemmatimonadales bacterium]|nr:hypothetical protein [Gemmatimonadales bacterium]
MTTDKDFKRLVRARMQKTHESYTAARSHFAAREPTSTRPSSPATDYARLAGRSDEIMKARTGCTWERWVKALDHVRAYEWSHRDIARYVKEKYKVADWWVQSVTVGYERIKGLRAIGQRRSGAWEASKSRTFAAPVDAIFHAFHDPRRRRRWMADAKPTIRSATPSKSMRMTWPDGTTVIVGFTAKGAAKSQVAVQHEKLPDQATAVQMKAYWAERLNALNEMLG